MNTTSAEIDALISEINWKKFETAYGSASDVPMQLKELSSDDEAKAKKAASALWAGLCHQTAYVSSAAIPSLPIMLRILSSASKPVQVEILDIVCGITSCLDQEDLVPKSEIKDWQTPVLETLLEQRSLLEALANDEHDEASHFAKEVLSATER